ncbi:MAG: hypothetical protein WEA29_01165 [Acidimicrobiia bacterium]
MLRPTEQYSSLAGRSSSARRCGLSQERVRRGNALADLELQHRIAFDD